MTNTTQNKIRKQVWYHETMAMFYSGRDSQGLKQHKESAENLRDQYKITEHWRVLNASFRGE